MSEQYTEEDLLNAILVATTAYDYSIQRYRDARAAGVSTYIDVYSMINTALAQLYIRTLAQGCDYSDTPQVKLLVRAMIDLQTKGHYNYPVTA